MLKTVLSVSALALLAGVAHAEDKTLTISGTGSSGGIALDGTYHLK